MLRWYFSPTLLFIQVPPLPLALALHTVTEIMKEGIDRVRNNVHLFVVCTKKPIEYVVGSY